LLDDGLVRVSVFEEDPQAEATSAAATTVANIADERAVVRNATVATGSRRPTRAARVHCRLPRRAVPGAIDMPVRIALNAAEITSSGDAGGQLAGQGCEARWPIH